MSLVRARKLVLEYGWNATAYQILNPGIHLWFSQDGEAVVGYVDWGKVRVAAGLPVCRVERLAQVVADFEKSTLEAGIADVCYFAAEERLKSLLGNAPGYSQVLIGTQPVWHPHSWSAIVPAYASLRAQLLRARNKGISTRLYSNQDAQAHPGIRLCLKEWLEAKPLPAMHFLVEPQILDRLWERKVFVAEKRGIPVGFLVASPVSRRRGWLIEQIVQGRLAPNGTAELLVDAAFRQAQSEGLEYFTLGLSPLSQDLPRAEDHPSAATQPGGLNTLFKWLRQNGGHFYDFRGLEAFKSKFIPDRREPVYAIFNQPTITPRVFLAIAGVFCGGKPISFIGKTILKAILRAISRVTPNLLNPNRLKKG